MTSIVAYASTSGFPIAPESSSSASSAALKACLELQEDEQLALEAIYEDRFECIHTADGGRVFAVQIEIDLQEDTECTIIQSVSSRGPSDRRATDGISKLTASARPFIPPQRDRGSYKALDSDSPANDDSGSCRSSGESHESRLSATNGRVSSNMGPLSMASVADALPQPLKPPQQTTRLRYLPPIRLSLTLPSNYPLEQPPRIDLQSIWLSSVMHSLLLQRLKLLWQNDACSYIMADEIQQCMLDTTILPRPLGLNASPSTLSSYSVNSLKEQLATYDRLTRYSTFSTESFACGICLENKKGARCARLKSCSHVFCVECLYNFWELNIREGQVDNVCCADWKCVRQNTSTKEQKDKVGKVGLDEIETIVGKDLAERYAWLVEKKKIESDPTVTYCPRKLCNAPVPKDEMDEYERLRMCPKCGYSFCMFCRRTYHGTRSRCAFSQSDSIVDSYVKGDDATKYALETKYGKSNITKLVETYLEEQANAKWIADHSTRCPDCQLDIERSMGCAHMTCTRCACHFCFRCGSRLNARDPYGHYSTPGMACYNRLFEYVPSDEQMNEALFQAMVA